MVALRSPVLDAQRLQRSDRAVDVLAELAARLPAWHLEAASRDADPDLFFVGRGQSIEPALEYCDGCPVRQECLDDAVDNHLTTGTDGRSSSPG